MQKHLKTTTIMVQNAMIQAMRDMISEGIEIGYLAVETFKQNKMPKTTGIYTFDSIARYNYYPPRVCLSADAKI